MNRPSMINDMNTKITKVFNNPNITFFIIMCLILLISCYTFINTPLRHTISSFISNPFIILFALIFVITLGFYNINIAILLLLLLFVSLFGATLFNSNNMSSKRNSNSIENFTDGTNEDEDDDEDDQSDDEEEVDRFKPKNNKKSNSDKIKEAEQEQDGKIDSIKNVLLGTVNKLKEEPKNELQKGILENKLTIYQKEKQNNKSKNSNSKSKFTNISNSKGKGKSKNNKGEGFQTVKTRTFDPTKEDDTNLLITKEVLQDMINRIEYDFENSKYLKKYLKHRIEEIVEMNKLLEDDD